MLYHRAPAFVEIYARVLGAPEGRSSRRSNEVLAVRRAPARGDGVRRRQPRPARATRSLVASCGKFGERWSELCEAYGARPSTGRPSGASRSTRPSSTGCWREHAGVEVVFTTLSRDLDRRRERRPATRRGRAQRHGALLAVDAVSGLGAVDLPQDEWGVDVVVAGSQKALMCPPGLALRLASTSARWSAPRAQPGAGRYYFDWEQDRARASARTRPTARSRPAVSLFLALDVALEMIEAGGPRAGLRAPRAARPRHARRRRGARPRAVRRPTTSDANVVTAIELPDDDRRRQGARS